MAELQSLEALMESREYNRNTEQGIYQEFIDTRASEIWQHELGLPLSGELIFEAIAETPLEEIARHFGHAEFGEWLTEKVNDYWQAFCERKAELEWQKILEDSIRDAFESKWAA